MKKLPVTLAIAAITAGAAQAANISIPDNQTAGTTVTEGTDISGAAGGTLFNGTAGNVAFVVTTLTFDATAPASRLRSHVRKTATSGDGLGLNVTSGGTVTLYTGAAGAGSLDLGAMAGTTTTFILKYEYTVGQTWINVWANPDGSEVEGLTTTTGGDIRGYNSTANSVAIGAWNTQVVQGASGVTNGVTNTVVLTGADATFANAMALAVPEPSSALLGGLGMLALLRRRRD